LWVEFVGHLSLSHTNQIIRIPSFFMVSQLYAINDISISATSYELRATSYELQEVKVPTLLFLS